MSKRNQKRIEHELKDLINDRDNSNKCGECAAGFPTWASVNLGIFLCGRCASLHRKLGEDVSVVKSLTLDKWNEEDLDNISSIGNKKARQFWNPKKVPFPYDDDDKDEIFFYLRQKYVQGKFRYSPPTSEDYNLNGDSSRVKSSGSHSHSSRSSGRRSSVSVPRLSHKDIPEIERLRYRKIEPKLESKGFRNTDDNYEALSLAKGDLGLAVEILSKSSASDEAKPPLPRRPGSSSVSNSFERPSTVTSNPTSAPAEWWNSNQQPIQNTTTASTATNTISGLIEPPQQYLDPATGVIYVDPVQQQLYLQQQQQLQIPAQTGYQTAYQTGLQTGYQVPQKTGLDKNQLLSLYGTNAQPQQQQQFQQQQPQQFQQQSQQTFQQQPQQFFNTQPTFPNY